MSVTKKELVQQFILTVSDDIKLYRKLLALLQQQKVLYLKFDSEALSNNIRNQLPVLKELGKNANLRSQSLQQLKLPSSEVGVKILIKALPETLASNLQNQWQQLEKLITECQKFNQDNGQSSAAFHELLGELMGHNQANYADPQLTDAGFDHSTQDQNPNQEQYASL